MEINLELVKIDPSFYETKAEGLKEKYTYRLEGTLRGKSVKMQFVQDEDIDPYIIELLGKPESSSIGNTIFVTIGNKRKQETLE